MTITRFRPKAALAAVALLSAFLLPALPALADPLPAPHFKDFSATKGSYDDMVMLEWEEMTGSTGIGEYEVIRYNAQDPTQPPTVLIGNVEPYTDTTFDDTTAEPGVIYKYIVRTWNTEGTLGETPFAFGWAGEVPPPAEEPSVTDLAATQGTYPDKIRLTWNSENMRWVESYVISRGEDYGDGPYSNDYTIPFTGDNFYEDTYVDPGFTYGYRLRFTDIWRRSTETDWVEGWAGPDPRSPAAPVMVSATSNRTDGILVTWQDGTERLGWHADTYDLQRLRDGYPDIWTVVATDLTETEYLDDSPSIVCGATYHYRAVARNTYGARTNNHPVAGMKLPEKPSVEDFTASRGEYPDRVWLNWTPSDPSLVRSYTVVRFIQNGSAVGVETLADSLTTPGYLDTTVTPNVRYYYQVRITDTWGRLSVSSFVYGWAFPVPDNDNFKDARPISAKSGTDASTNNCASFEVSEPYPAGVPSATRTVWWSFTAPLDGMVQFNTDGSLDLYNYGEEDAPQDGILTAMGIYTGDAVTKLDEVCSATPYVEPDGEMGYNWCSNSFEAVSGTVYRVQVSGYGEYEFDQLTQKWAEEWGLIRLNWSYTHYRVTFEPNGGTISTNVVMVPVGQKLGDALPSFPVPVREGYRFVDWKFENNASVSAAANFAIAESHTLHAEWEWIVSNDDFENALRLNAPSQTSGFSEMQNANATLQAGEPLLAAYPNATHTLWWSWIATEDCTVRISTTNSVDSHGSQIDTVLGVYTGSALGSLEQVVTGDDGVDESGFIDDIGTFWSFVEFEAKKGTVYYICVGVNDKYNRQIVEGTIRVNWGQVKGGISSGGYALLPPNAGPSDISAALAGSADERLQEILGDSVEDYNDFAEWANDKGGDEVRASSHAAPSYQLGTTELLQNEPVVTIEGAEVVPANGNASAGDSAKVVRPKTLNTPVTLTLEVTVRDGGEAVEVTAAKVAALVKATRDVCDWDSPEAILDPHASAVTSGSATTVTIVVTPGDGSEPQAFLRVAP